VLRKTKAMIRRLLLDRAPWDPHFDRWIKSAVARGVDPNDVGDEAWANDGLADVLNDLYLNYVPAGAVVLELGPGTGRLTRHLITRARKVELIDNSKFVIKWMNTYLAGKIDFRTHLVKGPQFPSVADDSVDTVVAHGVFEHLDFDETYWFLTEFRRVLKVGGHASYNYDTLHSQAGRDWFLEHRREPGSRCIFRFYTPDFMQRIAQVAGLEVVRSVATDRRLSHIVLMKPAD
jgi:ubiquinone/menaquinone biosynthesis C-methylase UbiE